MDIIFSRAYSVCQIIYYSRLALIFFSCVSVGFRAQKTRSVGVGKLARLTVAIGGAVPFPLRHDQPANRKGHVHIGVESERQPAVDDRRCGRARQTGSRRTGHGDGMVGRSRRVANAACRPVDFLRGRGLVETRRGLFERIAHMAG